MSLLSFAVLLSANGLCAENGSGAPGGNGSQVCQVAWLHNGFTIQYARLESAGPNTRLWLCPDAGYVEIPSAQIERLEPSQNAAPPAPVPTTGAPETSASGVLPVSDPIADLIAGAALRHLIDPDFVNSVVKAESGFIPTAVSPQGARGLMQLMPQTAAELGVEDPFDPAANVEGGTRYLRMLLDQYGGDVAKALAAYNAGPERVEQFGGVPPYRETRAYVAGIIEDYNRKKLQQRAVSVPATK